MTRLMRLVLGGCFTILALSAPVGAQQNAPRKVQDDAGLFSKEAKDKANAQIAHIKKTYDKDVLVETVSRIDDPLAMSKDPETKNRFIDQWVEAKFKSQRVNGVYVVIVKDPRTLRVETGPETLKHGFFTKERERMLAKALIADLGAKQYDLALDRAVSEVGEGFAARGPTKGGAPSTRPAPGPQNQVEVSPLFGWLCVGIVVLLGLWLVIGIFRGIAGMFNRGGGGYGPGQNVGQGAGYGPGGYGGGPGGGGGGFFSSLLGGMFGSMAGSWMYNNFFGGHSHGNYTPPASAVDYGNNPGQIPSDVGSSGTPSISGGDWDDGSAGGSKGGTADTGGDWGGGGGAEPPAGDGADWGSSGGGDSGGFTGGDAGGGGDWGGGGGGGDFGGGGGGDTGGSGGDW